MHSRHLCIAGARDLLAPKQNCLMPAHGLRIPAGRSVGLVQHFAVVFCCSLCLVHRLERAATNPQPGATEYPGLLAVCQQRCATVIERFIPAPSYLLALMVPTALASLACHALAWSAQPARRRARPDRGVCADADAPAEAVLGLTHVGSGRAVPGDGFTWSGLVVVSVARSGRVLQRRTLLNTGGCALSARWHSPHADAAAGPNHLLMCWPCKRSCHATRLLTWASAMPPPTPAY